MDYLGKIEQGVTSQFGEQYGQQFGQLAQGLVGGGQPAGLKQWGSSPSYAVKNLSTGMYLAAHQDGQLVAEDDTTGHHDVPWSIYSTRDGRVALKSCHGKFLDTDGNDLPTNNARDPNEATWEMAEQGQGVYSLRSPDGQFLRAVPPNGEQQQVLLSNQCGQSEVWQLEPMSAVTGAVDNLEGQFF